MKTPNIRFTYGLNCTILMCGAEFDLLCAEKAVLKSTEIGDSYEQRFNYGQAFHGALEVLFAVIRKHHFSTII